MSQARNALSRSSSWCAMHGQAGAQYVLIISPHPASWNLISYLSCGVVMSAGNDSEAYSDLLEDFFNCKGRTHFYTLNNLFLFACQLWTQFILWPKFNRKMGPVNDDADHISQESVETTLEAGMEDTCRPFDQACPDCCPCLSEMFGWCSNYAQVLNMYNYTICTAVCTYTLQDIYILICMCVY